MWSAASREEVAKKWPGKVRPDPPLAEVQVAEEERLLEAWGEVEPCKRVPGWVPTSMLASAIQHGYAASRRDTADAPNMSSSTANKTSFSSLSPSIPSGLRA